VLLCEFSPTQNQQFQGLAPWNDKFLEKKTSRVFNNLPVFQALLDTHYRIHKNPPRYSVLSQLKPVYNLAPHIPSNPFPS